MSGGEKPDKVITVALKVSINCNACEKRVKKALWKLDGVESVLMDMENQKATVTGRVDPQIVLKKLKKRTGKRAELWQDPDRPENAPSGEGNSEVRARPRPSICDTDEATAFLTYFNDENPNSCTIS